MDVLLFVAGLIGFAPALAVLYYVLRDYDYPKVEKPLFNDTRVFLMIGIGMVIATVLYIIEGSLFQSFWMKSTADRAGAFDIGMFVVIYVFLFCLVEEGGKLMVLLFPAFRKNFDVVFYGLALGCGMSAVAVLLQVFISIGSSGTIPEPIWFVAIALYSITFALLHASTGAIIAEGSRKGEPWPYFARAFFFRAIVAAFMAPYFWTENLWYSLPFMLILSFLIFWDVQKRVIPDALPEEVRPDRARRRRRRA